ncbi:MAG: tRNA (adenosine(37)-N6)-dimethylallyltransferase MiaA [Bacteroidales bacterium]|nr:tRNA (adenosine(37)-N6)-dimethylallyltransferase MiaA [Bacteroidales bacterium]
MPRLKHSIPAELPAPEQLDFAQLAADCAQGRCDLIVVLGPTASGKTRYAVALAEEFRAAAALGLFEGCPTRMTDDPGITGAEIISADSRQVYRGMDIGTGKDLAEYGEVPFHLIDIAEPGTQYNVWQFQQDFLRAYADIRSRGAVPILCGGTGMYINAVTRGYDFSGTTPLSTPREGAAREGFPKRPFFIGTLVDRETRNARIDTRLDARLQEGMIDEIRGLLERGVPAEALIAYGLEYKFVTLHLQGVLSFEEMRTQLATAIHQFAKRQMTWFRGMERSGVRIHWVEV